ncbi:MAG: Na+/H+ antiporter subunit E [bacterium]
MKSRILLFIIAVGIWILLTCSVSWQYLVVGLAAAFLVAWLSGGLFTKNPWKFKGIKRYFIFLFQYCPLFLWEATKANIDVAYRVSHPMLPIKPGIVKVKTALLSDTGITFLANSITLTPGTLTVDVDRANGFLYIHWINVKDQDIEGATKRIVLRFEGLLKEIFE